MQDNISRVNQRHLAFSDKMAKHPKVTTTRVLGTIFALEVKSDAAESYYGTMRNQLYAFFIDNGIIIRPVGNIVYILPPYIITDEQLNIIYETVEAALEKIG